MATGEEVVRVQTRYTDCLVVYLCLAVSSFAVEAPSLVLNPFVMAPPALTALERAKFLLFQNPTLSPGFSLNMALLYEEEASAENVSPDIAFAQMCLETSYLRFGNQVRAGQYNFAGLGAVDGGTNSLTFGSPREGVRAQVQHLKYYASTLPLQSPPVNPRLVYVSRGIAPTVWQLAGTWASDADYGKKLLAVLQRMLGYARTSTR
jgi:hypothetical protein